MTIKDFSILCGTTTQTLRYYDNIGLLKPTYVDYLTGYRHYKEEQALTFVKIKKLQEASFTIEEIKKLLTKDDEFIYNVIDLKIQEERIKLDKLIKIKESYRSEKEKMIDKINDIKLQFIKEAKKIDSFDEFGISQEEYLKMVNSQSEMFDLVGPFLENDSLDLIKKMDEANFEEPNENFNPLEEENNTIIYQYHDFKKVKEALANIPSLVNDEKYVLYLTLADDKIKNMALLGIIVQLILDKNKEIKINLTAHSSISNDNKNHLFLLKSI